MGIVAIANSSCKKQLQIGNPNSPTVSGNVNDESGLISLAEGGVYENGFADGDGWLGNSYFSLPYGYLELMSDNIGADASNNQITTVGYPTYFIMDDGTQVTNGSPSISILRGYNVLGGSGNNPLFFQWQNMYALNAACNQVLSIVPSIKFGGDATSRMNTVLAWCYWWKGFAYSQVGTMYYSGLVQDDLSNKTNSHYLPKDSILARSNYYLNLAATTINGISSSTDYSTVLGELIPSPYQVQNGGVLTPTMWIHNINSLLARNIIANGLAPYVNGNPNASITKASTGNLTSDDWNNIVTLASSGIQSGDLVFTAQSTATNSIFSAGGGNVAANTTGNNISSTFKISVRFVANFKPTDKRLAQNFWQGSTYNNPFYGTPYNIADSLSQSTNGVAIMGSKLVGGYQVFIGPSYEENELMLAEANIRLGNIATGLSHVDNVRDYQGAGVGHVSGTVTTLAGAMAELTSESRVALFGRGQSFYGARRWGWIYDISNGGGQYGQLLYNADGTWDTNVTVNYNFMDYWDIPADETQLNPPAAGTSPILNPNY
jgi:starch-binding outer membrane protein, SusD/RagB family